MVQVVLIPRVKIVRHAVEVALAAAVLLPNAMGAQPHGGSVFVAGVADAETGQPLEGAEVILLGAYRFARANALGEATISNVPRGVQHVRVRRLGYTPLEVDVAVARDTTGAVFRLRRSAVKLASVDVTADWLPPKIKDVEIRRRQGIGRFLDATQLEQDADREFALVATTKFPGLTTNAGVGNHRILYSSRPLCKDPVLVYLDDVLISGAPGNLMTDDSDLVRTWDLAVVEYYTGAQVPVRYRSHGYGCGVLLLWSKWN